MPKYTKQICRGGFCEPFYILSLSYLHILWMNFNLLITTSLFYVYFTINCLEWKLRKIVMNIACRVILKLKCYSDLRTRFGCEILPLLLKMNIWIWPSLLQAVRCEIMSYIHLKLKIEREKFNKTFSNLNKQINKEKKLLNAGKTKGLIEEHEVPYKTGILFCFSDIFFILQATM